MGIDFQLLFHLLFLGNIMLTAGVTNNVMELNNRPDALAQLHYLLILTLQAHNAAPSLPTANRFMNRLLNILRAHILLDFTYLFTHQFRRVIAGKLTVSLISVDI